MAFEYEFVFLTPPGVEEEDLKETFSDLEKQVKSIDGKVEDKEDLGENNLAYMIKGNGEANFWVWKISVPQGVNFSSLKTFLNRSEIIIRYLLLNLS